MNRIEINIDIEPKAFSSHEFGHVNGKAYLYNPKEKIQYQKDLYYLIRKSVGSPFSKLHGTVAIRILIFYFDAKKKSDIGKIHDQKPDVDNLQKTLFDVLKDNFMDDDRNIGIIEHVSKVWCEPNCQGIYLVMEEIEHFSNSPRDLSRNTGRGDTFIKR